MSHTIKHISICGGLSYGFIFYGIIKNFIENKFINMKELKSIHATSVGSVIGTIIAVEQDQSILYNYILNRPWDDVFQFSVNTFLKSVKSCGMLNEEPIIKFLDPIFLANDLDIRTVTMLELYEHTKIDIHIYTTNVNTIETTIISHKTHPEWRVLDAIYVSCSIPILFQPFRDPDTKHFYIDGGFLINYPIIPCIKYCKECNDPIDSILGIQLYLKDGCGECVYDVLYKDSLPSLMDYVYTILNKLLYKLANLQPMSEYFVDSSLRPIEIFVRTDKYCMDIMPLLKNKNIRKEYIQMGEIQAHEFLLDQQKQDQEMDP